MCHDTAEAFIRDHVDLAFPPGDILEVGAATGVDWKAAIPHISYVGVDLKPGPNVDVLCDFEDHELAFEFDLVICAEVLEHTPRPWKLIENLSRHTRARGHAIITARGYDAEGCAPVHDTVDYWRMRPDSLRIMMEDAGFAVLVCEEDPSLQWPGVLAVGER